MYDKSIHAVRDFKILVDRLNHKMTYKQIAVKYYLSKARPHQIVYKQMLKIRIRKVIFAFKH
jgi:hypothetical protein